MKELFKIYLFIFFICGWTAEQSWGAACCGSSSSLPSLIIGDESAQLGIGFSMESVIGDAGSERFSVFRADADHEKLQSLRISGAMLLSDRWQIGGAIPLSYRSREVGFQSAHSSGLGDVSLNLGYELLPEWEYSSWKPHGFLFWNLLLPTGKSVDQSHLPWSVDAFGKGFLTASTGMVFSKVLRSWTFLIQAEVHYSFSRAIDDPEGRYQLIPGWGGSLGLNAGYVVSRLPLSFHLGVQPQWDMGIQSSGSIASQSGGRMVWNATSQCTYSIDQDWNIGLTYLDQTLIGPARNTTLSRSVALNLQKAWQR